jgi:hypothetical protein
VTPISFPSASFSGLARAEQVQSERAVPTGPAPLELRTPLWLWAIPGRFPRLLGHPRYASVRVRYLLGGTRAG